MGARQFAELIALSRIEPIGEDRADFRTALLCLVIAKAAGSKDSKFEDFEIDFDTEEEPEPPSTDSMRDAMLAFSREWNAAFRKKSAAK